MSAHWTRDAEAAIAAARRQAADLGRPTTGTEHLLAALLASENSAAAPLLTAAGISVEAVRQWLAPHLVRSGTPLPEVGGFTSQAEAALAAARREAEGGLEAGLGHLLLGLLAADGIAHDTLVQLGVNRDALREAARHPAPPSSVEPPGEASRKLSGLATDAGRALRLATEEARRRQHREAGSLHLLWGLLRLGGYAPARRALHSLGASAANLKRGVEIALETLPQMAEAGESRTGVQDATQPIQARAHALARSLQSRTTSSLHLLMALAESAGPAAGILIGAGVTFPRLRQQQACHAVGEMAGSMTREEAKRMWQRFTERARRVVFFAQEEAARLGENYVSTEHLLLGLVRESDSVAARVLDRLGVSLGRIRNEVEKQVTRGRGNLGRDMQLSPHAKRVIDLAYDEARQLKNEYIGTEHLLLGLIREGDGSAARVLIKLGVDLERAHREVAAMREDETRHYTGRSRFDPSAVADSPADAAQRLIAALARARDGATTPEQTGARLEGEFLGLLRASQPDLKHLRGITDLTRAGAHALLTYAGLLKQSLPVRLSVHDRLLRGQTLAMIFEKPSLRTRVTFEVGMAQLGGRAIYLQPSDIQLRKRESVPDVARNLGRWVDGIMARTFVHQTILDLAEHAGVPVINGLSDLEHPCQALADFLTIQERLGEITGKKVVFVGDGNNVAHSLLLLGGLLGAHMVVACPEGYEPRAEILEATQAYAAASGGSAEVMHDPTTAVQGAHAVYTDVWASMGQEAEAEQRAQVFAPFQVNAELLAAALPEAIVMHCLPAHRGQEITDAVLDGLQSVVLDQAENRLHAQKAVLVMLMSQK